MDGKSEDYLNQVIQAKKGIFRSQIRQKKIKASLQSRRDVLMKASEINEYDQQQQNQYEQQINAQDFSDNLLVDLQNNLSQALSQFEQAKLSAESEDEISWEGLESVIEQIQDIPFDRFSCTDFQSFIITKMFSKDVLEIVKFLQNKSSFIIKSLVPIARKLLAAQENDQISMYIILKLNSSGFLNLLFQEFAQKCNESKQISEFQYESSCFILKLVICAEKVTASSIQSHQNNEGNNLITSLFSAATHSLQFLSNTQHNLRFPLALAICQLLDTANQNDFLEIIIEPNFLLSALCDILLEQNNVSYVATEAILEVFFQASSMLEDNQFEQIQARRLILNAALNILKSNNFKKGSFTDGKAINQQNVIISLRILIDLYNGSSNQTEILNQLLDNENRNNQESNLSIIMRNLIEFKYVPDILNEFMSFISILIISAASNQSQSQIVTISSLLQMIPISLLTESLQSTYLYHETQLEILQAIRSILVYSEKGQFTSEEDQILANNISNKTAVEIIRAGDLRIFEKLFQEQTQQSNSSILELLEEISEILQQFTNNEEY